MLKYANNIYSQFGEDGILEYLINILEIQTGECCEVGMQGTLYSNTFNLIQNKNWFGVWVETNRDNLINLNQYKEKYRVDIIDAFVEKTGECSLDNLLSKTKLSKNFDVLSIDIDGNDYHIWDSLKNYNPKIVIIEINPFYKPGVEYVHNGSIYGSSFTSMVNLGLDKGYTLISMTGNLVFIKSELLKNTELENYINLNPNDLFLDDAIAINKREITFRRYMKRTLI